MHIVVFFCLLWDYWRITICIIQPPVLETLTIPFSAYVYDCPHFLLGLRRQGDCCSESASKTWRHRVLTEYDSLLLLLLLLLHAVHREKVYFYRTSNAWLGRRSLSFAQRRNNVPVKANKATFRRCQQRERGAGTNPTGNVPSHVDHMYVRAHLNLFRKNQISK